jgi:hypothetical protein
VEFLVVLAIVGVITAVAAPELRSVLRRLSPESPGDRLAAILQVARSEAVRSGQTACFELDPASGLYQVRVLSGSRDSVLLTGELGSGGGGELTGSAVCFYPSGVATPGWRLWLGEYDRVVVEVDSWDGRISIVR